MSSNRLFRFSYRISAEIIVTYDTVPTAVAPDVKDTITQLLSASSISQMSHAVSAHERRAAEYGP